jgi:hypothetical protein
MKTLRNRKTGEIKRLNDREAQNLVKQSFLGWEYTSKQSWKNENNKKSK